jgi:LacI family repressor for deo operon, udp, cdd, tsx, nupC, and nupG
MNNIGSVRESTRERVYKAMNTVGYPIPEAEPAALSSSRTILVMITNLGNFFTGKELDGIFSVAYYHGFDCVIYRQKHESYSFEEMRSIAESVRACGILMSLPNVPAEIMNKLSELYPIVQFSEFAKDCSVPYVSVDDRAAAKMATSFLLKLGRRRIAIVNGPKRFKYARDRERGYFDALQEYGIEPDPALNISIVSGVPISCNSAVKQLFSLESPPDAVFAVADIIAAGVMKSLTEIGKSIPKEVAVISCEDTELAQYLTPALSSVSQPTFRIGQQACSMLVDIINGHWVSLPQTMLSTELVMRDST